MRSAAARGILSVLIGSVLLGGVAALLIHDDAGDRAPSATGPTASTAPAGATSTSTAPGGATSSPTPGTGGSSAGSPSTAAPGGTVATGGLSAPGGSARPTSSTTTVVGSGAAVATTTTPVGSSSGRGVGPASGGEDELAYTGATSNLVLALFLLGLAAAARLGAVAVASRAR